MILYIKKNISYIYYIYQNYINKVLLKIGIKNISINVKTSHHQIIMNNKK